MIVLHVLDRYLNQTMNWVHRLMVNTPAEHLVSAEVHFKNKFEGENVWQTKSLIQALLPEGRDEWRPGELQRLYGPLLRPYHIRYLKKEVDHRHVDVIHIHFANVAARYLPLVEATKVPVVVSFYGYDYTKAVTADPGLQKKYSRLFALVSAFVVEGQHGKDVLIQMGCPEDKIKVLHLGINIDTLPMPIKKKKSGSLKLIQPATFSPKKGQDMSVQAINALGHLPNLELTLMGEDVDRVFSKQVRALIDRSAAKVKIEPFVAFEDFYKKLGDYDVILQPSRHAHDGDSEGGAPVSLIDAQYCGLPAISTYHCDIPEVVIHDETGKLVEEEDITGISKMIRFFYDMENEEFQSWSQRAHEHIRQQFDINESGARLLEIYKGLK